MALKQYIQLSTEGKRTDSGSTVRDEWRLVDDSVSSNVADIWANWVAATGCDIGTEYIGADNTICKSLTFKRSGGDKQADGPYVWHLTVEFAKREDVKFKSDCKIKTSLETNDETDGRYDVNGVLNINSAGDFFDDKLPLKNKLMVFSYSLNYYDNPNAPGRLAALAHKTNASTWHGLSAGTCLLRSFSTNREKDEEQGHFYWATDIEIAYNPLGWKYLKADCGFYTNDGRILNDEGAPVEQAQLLDGNGNINQSGNPVMLEFDLYESGDFGVMNLPSPFEDNPS